MAPLGAWVGLALGALAATPASADPAAPERPSAGVLVIAPQAAAIRVGRSWDVGVGGGALTAFWRDGRLAVLAAGLSGIAVSEYGGGRVEIDLVAALRGPAGGLFGLALGPTAEVDTTRPPRAGAHVTAWALLGIAPYARVSAVDRTGIVVDFGLAIPLPTLRW
jgi:hypothetical protein